MPIPMCGTPRHSSVAWGAWPHCCPVISDLVVTQIGHFQTRCYPLTKLSTSRFSLHWLSARRLWPVEIIVEQQATIRKLNQILCESESDYSTPDSGIWKFEMRPNGRLPDKQRTRDPRNTISDLLSLGRQKRVGYNRQLTRLPAPHQCVFGSIVLFVQGALSFSRGRVCCYRAAIHAEVTAALQTIRAKKTKAETWKRTAGTIGPCGAVEVRAALSKVHIGRMSLWSSSGHCSS